MIPYVVFDLCGTLVKENTTQDFIVNHLNKGLLKHLWVKLAYNRIAQLTARLVGFDFPRYMLISTLKGMDVENVQRQANHYATLTLAKNMPNQIITTLKKAQEQGATVVIASASIEPVVKAFCLALKVSYYVCTELKTKNGKYLGYIDKDATGQKWNLISVSFNVNEKNFLFITDNSEDFSTLLKAKKGILLTNKQPAHTLNHITFCERENFVFTDRLFYQ